MKHQAFTEIVAKATGVPEKTVAIFARNLKSASLLTSGARGVNAPEMTLLDLTRMLIALCATDRPSDAVDAVNLYRTARCVNVTSIKIGKAEIEIPLGAELEELLSNLLAFPFVPLVNMNLHLFIYSNRLEAELLIDGNSIAFAANENAIDKEAKPQSNFRGISTRRGIGADEIEEMTLPFILERADGRTWEEIFETGSAAKVFARHALGAKDGAAE